MKWDLDSLTLTEIIQLQTQLSQTLQRRFEKSLALAFTDVAGSTEYFARYGDEAGRRMVQRHLDILQRVLPGVGGRIVDTAGDGAFTCFPSADAARQAMVELQLGIMRENTMYTREQQLAVRCGIHYGQVLTDGVLVSGDAVNLCARVASSANSGEIRVTRAAFQELLPSYRMRCRDLKTLDLKGIGRPVEVLTLEWRDTANFPSSVYLVEMRELKPLPDQDLISFGRLRDINGVPANDVVLELPDQQTTLQISRFQFELRRRPEGFVLRSVSDQITEVEGSTVAKGQEVPLRSGMKVRVARLLTLEFRSSASSAPPPPPETRYNAF